MKTLKQIHGKYLLVFIAMSGLFASSVGIMTNAAGIFFTPIAEELGQPTAAINLTLTISNIAFAVAGLFSARWVKPQNLRKALPVCTLLFAGSTALLSFCGSLFSLYLMNAVRGFAAGLIGNVLVTSVLGKWFLSDTGFITSLVLGFSGLTGALFNPVLEAVIRTAGWRTAYLVTAGLIILFNLPAMVFRISFVPEDSGMLPIGGHDAEGSKDHISRKQNGEETGWYIQPLAFIAISLASLVASIPQLFKPLAATYGLSETGILMMSVVLAVNTAGKFLFGMMTDRLGVRRSVLIYGLVIAAGILLLLLLRVSGVMLVSAAMIGLCYSIPSVGAVMICRELFSPDQYGKVFPKINLGASVTNALGYPVLGMIFDRTGKYDGALVLLFTMMLISVAGVLLVYRLAGRTRKT